MIIYTPSAGQLCLAPELAILATLEATLASTIEVMRAAHPELDSTSVFAEDSTVDADVAAATELSYRAGELIDAINAYRRAAVDPDLLVF